MTMDQLFHLMATKKASDLFLAVGSPVHIKINGTSVPINQQVLSRETIQVLLSQILSEPQFSELENSHELNIALSVHNVGRFRLSAFFQRGSISVVVRFIQSEIPGLDTLNLPAVLSDIIMEKRGLVLVAGATGSGKSTTIASMLDHRNDLKTGHILTLEDPIEYMFRNKKSIINQREIGTDTETMQIGLKNALRQAPDCILIGEIRDKETMSSAISYAQSGHLCVATLHANNSYHALNRIIGFYPMENRPALFSDLSTTLKSIISQRLIKATSSGRIPAIEVMLNTRLVAELIEKGEISTIKDAMERSLAPGSQTFEQALYQLLKSGLITQQEALGNSDSPTNMLWLINNAAPLAVEKTGDAPKARKERDGASFTEFTLHA